MTTGPHDKFNASSSGENNTGDEDSARATAAAAKAKEAQEEEEAQRTRKLKAKQLEAVNKRIEELNRKLGGGRAWTQYPTQWDKAVN